MEREIWDIVRVVEDGRLTAIEAHKKLCALFNAANNKQLLCSCDNVKQKR